jgi:hypothetical protein
MAPPNWLYFRGIPHGFQLSIPTQMRHPETGEIVLDPLSGSPISLPRTLPHLSDEDPKDRPGVSPDPIREAGSMLVCESKKSEDKIIKKHENIY